MMMQGSNILTLYCLIWSACPETKEPQYVCFLPGLYEFVIPEDLPLEKMGGRVKANDRDIGENSKSTYGIVEGNEQGMFEIVTDTQTQEGILRLKKVSWKRFTSSWEAIAKGPWASVLLCLLKKCNINKMHLWKILTRS